MSKVSSSNGLEKCPKLRFPGFDESLAKFEIGNACEQLKETIDPRTTPTEFYAEYSMPAFDNNRKVAKVQGKDMNSVRKVMSKPCVLINKLNVRKKRIWLVDHPEKNAVSSTEFVPLSSTMMSLGYLNYVALTDRFTNYMLNCSSGSSNSQKRVTPDDILDYVITAPSLLEQERIARFLETIDSKIRAQEDLIELLKKYKRGVMRAIFRDKALLFSNAAKWESVRLDNECTFFSGGTPKSTDSRFYGGTIPFIRSGEIHGEKTELFLTDDGLKYSSAKTVSKGDLILALYGATSGEVDIAKIDGAINQAILCIRPSRINRTFLKYLLEDSQDDILNTYLQGGQGNLSAEIIKNLVFEIPDEQSQSKVVIFLSAIDQRIISSCVYVEKLTEFRSGLLQKLFI